jgi:hypothetical protein
MNKLKSRGAKSSLANLSKQSEEQKTDSKKERRLTTVNEKTATTYKVSPLTMRLSVQDKTAVSNWVDELQANSKRKVSPAKLMRALTEMKDDIDQEALLKLIDEM